MTSTGILPGVLIIVILIALSIGTEIAAIFMYPVYKKANAPQKWFAFIPVLSILPLFSVAKMSRWWFLLMLGLGGATVASESGTLHTPNAHMPVLYYVFAVLSSSFSFYVTRRVFKSFAVPNWVVWTLLILLICELLMHINVILTLIVSLVVLASAVILIVYWCRMAWGKFYYDASRIS